MKRRFKLDFGVSLVVIMLLFVALFSFLLAYATPEAAEFGQFAFHAFGRDWTKGEVFLVFLFLLLIGDSRR